MKKFDKIRRLGHKDTNGVLSGNGPLYIKEKVDGANFRFTVDTDENRLLFGSRNVEWKNERDTDKNFRHAVEYVRDRVDVRDIERMPLGTDKLTFYGEAMHPHTLEYADSSGTEIGWRGVPSFIGFDVLYRGEFKETSTAKSIFEELGLPFVNIINSIDPSDFMDLYGADYVPGSKYYDGKAEGCVLVNDSNGKRAKLVSEQFAEKHGSVNSGVNPNDMGKYDTHEVIETYCTDARIRKHVHKLQDEGHELGRPMMSELPVRVTRDIIEEEAHEFATSNWVVDFNELRSEIASGNGQTNCLNVIDKMMSKQASENGSTKEVEA